MSKLGMEPAFSRKGTPRNSQFITEAWAQDGMSVRTYAAIAAMQGMIISPAASSSPENMAIDAIACADALLAELSKSNSGEGA
jgi:hypothetical protein